MTRVCVLKPFETKQVLGDRTEEGKGKEKSGNNERGEQREIPMFRKEVDDGSIEDQTQANAKS